MNSFADFARAHGLEVHDLFPSDKVQRCATIKHPKSKDGAWWWDGHRGWVSDWSQGGEIHWFDNPLAKSWTEQERRDWTKRKFAKEHQRQLDWRAAAERAQELLRHAKPETHYYLNAKGLPDVLGQVVETALLVPMRNLETNALQGVQIIEWNSEERCYDKKMNYGMRAKGAVLRLGNRNAKETFLVEGYATGLSIELAVRQMRLNASVLICFSDSNLAHVASLLKGAVFIYADNDKSQAGEVAARKTGYAYVMSDVTGNDANDDMQQFGVMHLVKKLMAVRAIQVAA